MNYKDILIPKLKCFRVEDIVITNHAYLQSIFREISIEEIKENIINPVRLQYADKQSNEKFDCYFATVKYCVIGISWLLRQNVLCVQ